MRARDRARAARVPARQLPVDVAADDAGFVLADVAALDRVWERTRHGVQAPKPSTDSVLADRFLGD
jgi:hypothetical protein